MPGLVTTNVPATATPGLVEIARQAGAEAAVPVAKEAIAEDAAAAKNAIATDTAAARSAIAGDATTAKAAIAQDVADVRTREQNVTTLHGQVQASAGAAAGDATRAENAAAAASSIVGKVVNLRLPPALIAHRGGGAMAPENTLAAFRNAAALGILDWDMDLQPSSDDVIVLVHDNSTLRTTGQDYEVIATPYSVLRTLDAGKGFSSRFASEPIPTWAEVLQAAKDCGARIYAEYKRYRSYADIDRIIALVKAYGMEDQVELSSFFLAPLQYTRTLSSRITLGLLTNKNFNDVPALAAVRPASIVTDQALILAQPEQVPVIRAAGLGLSAWTVNTADSRDTLARIGVDRILSDYDLRTA